LPLKEKLLMSSPVPYLTSFVLDKAHFSECFEQSSKPIVAKDYIKAVVAALLGIILIFFADVSKYLAYFIVCIGAVEACSVYYRKTWWLWRQMISKAYDHTVELEITDRSVITTSFHVNAELAWADITKVVATDVGILLYHPKGVNYLSNSYLSDDVIEYIKNKG